jgi:hypothetical protein
MVLKNEKPVLKKKREQDKAKGIFGQAVLLDEVMEMPDEKEALDMLLSGHSIAYTASQLNRSEHWVKDIAERAELHREAILAKRAILKATLEDKGPLLKDIQGLSLQIAKIRLEQILSDGELIAKIGPRDLKDLMAVGLQADGWERLDKEPTKTIDMSGMSEAEADAILADSGSITLALPDVPKP